MRFYCPECKKVIGRRFVSPKTFEEGYKCKWCGTTVYSTAKLLAKIFEDFIVYLKKSGEDMSDYEA